MGMTQVAKLLHKPNPSPPVAISKTISNGYARIKINETIMKKTIVRNKYIFFLF
jgi:hypothetical protein